MASFADSFPPPPPPPTPAFLCLCSAAAAAHASPACDPSRRRHPRPTLFPHRRRPRLLSSCALVPSPPPRTPRPPRPPFPRRCPVPPHSSTCSVAAVPGPTPASASASSSRPLRHLLDPAPPHAVKDRMSIILLQSMEAVSHDLIPDLIPFSTRMIERTSACGVQAFVASSASICRCSPSAPSTAAAPLWPAVPPSAGVHLQPHRLLPLSCRKILQSTTVDPSLHATSSITSPNVGLLHSKHGSPASMNGALEGCRLWYPIFLLRHQDVS